MILLARRVEGKHGPLLQLADITVNRNAFGRQVDSFEKDIEVHGIKDEGRPFRAVFIRAPMIVDTGTSVEVMASVSRGAVLARDGHYLLSAFHPELTGDRRIHEFFVDMARKYSESGAEV